MNRLRQLVGRFFPGGQFARNVALLAGGTALSQLLAVLAAPALTRLYRAEDFGYLQVYLSIMAFAILAVTLRYEQAIFLPDQEEIAANLVAVTLSAVALVSIVLGGLAWLATQFHTLPKSVEPLRPYLWIIPLSVCGAGIYQTLSFWALRQKAYSRVTGTKLTQVISMLGTQVLAGFAHLGVLGLLGGDALGRAGGSLSLGRLSWTRSRDAFRQVRWNTMWSAAVRYRRFPLISTGSSLLSVAGYALPALLLAQFYGAKTLGWFALGDRVMGAPSLLVGQAVAQVFSVEAARLSNSNPEGLHSLFLRLVRRLVFFGAVPCAALLFFAPSLFAFVFGEDWREAGTYARLLAPMHYVAFIAWPLTPTLNLLEEQGWQLAWDAARLIMTVTSLWFVYHVGLPARWGVAALGLVLLATYAAHLILCRFAISRRIRQFRASAAGPGSCSTAVSQDGQPVREQAFERAH